MNLLKETFNIFSWNTLQQTRIGIMNQSNHNRRSVSINRSFNVAQLYPNQAILSLEESDELMETNANSGNIERPVTRSFSKLQNAQLNNAALNSGPTLAAFNSNLSILDNLKKLTSTSLHKQAVKPPPTYQKILIDEKPTNVINLIENSMLTGKRPRTTVNVY